GRRSARTDLRHQLPRLEGRGHRRHHRHRRTPRAHPDLRRGHDRPRTPRLTGRLRRRAGPAPAGGMCEECSMTALRDRTPWGPRGRRDPSAAYDEMRSQCPVARGPSGAWTLFTHADVTAAAVDHQTFSNAVSAHLQVPNGLDEAVHTAFRAVVDRYFTRERMRALEPAMERVADDLVSRLEVPGSIDAVEIGSRFAVRAQSMWLGWPAALEEELLEWIGDNHAATRSRDRTR